MNQFRDSLAGLATLVVINIAPVPARAQTANLPVPPAGFDQVKNGVPKGTVTLVNYQTQSNGSDVLLSDLIPYIEANYSVVKASSGRALAGLSMGGGQTLAFGFGNVDVFTHLGIFSPAPNSPNPPANAFTDLEATKREVKVIYLSCGTVEQPYRGTCEAYDEYMNDNGI